MAERRCGVWDRMHVPPNEDDPSELQSHLCKFHCRGSSFYNARHLVSETVSELGTEAYTYDFQTLLHVPKTPASSATQIEF